MSDNSLEAYLAEHPKLTGALFMMMLLRLRTGAATTRGTAYAGP